ncbi:hypothetical protein GIB67_004474 [Kingdonia uniflora]|uniref:Uncharacterized protein n=1 Tax=Kingdonia uniflora TaxID=39325 RepID=A0A7J7MRN3_9MAGN|nr:hypothetical protein GIB67_004474 [Kingdonia uniflora]
MKGKQSVSVFQLFRYADGVDKLLVLFGTLGSIGDGMMTPLTMLVMSGLVNEFGSSGISFNTYLVDKYSLRLVYVAIGVGISGFIEGVCWTRTAERQTSRIRQEYLKSVLRQDVGFFDNQASTTFEVVSSLTSNIHSIQDVLAEKIPNCLAHLASFISCLITAFLLSWRLAIAALPFSLMFVVPGICFGKRLMSLGAKIKGAYGLAGGIAEQAVSSIRTVFSFVGEHQTLERFSCELQRSMELGIKQGLTKGMLIGSMGTIYAVWAFQAWVGSILVIERGELGGRIFVAGICIILGGFQRESIAVDQGQIAKAGSFMNTLPHITFFAAATAAASSIFEMIDRIPIIDSENENGKILENVIGELEFKDVTFRYPSRPDKLILDAFNLKVQAGKTVGLVGGSGSGKSTAISLLQRFYDPVSGNIFLDGNKIMKLQIKWLRSQMGLVSQEPILFATSIKENIMFGKEESSMDLVISAAKAANAHDFITKLSDGYETSVGQFGVQLSGGQKQRIAIARALIRDPKILLLDEATSALDAQSESIVQEALDQASQGRTTVVIAHRLSTIRRANLIVVLESGKIIESGTHEELVQKKDKFGGAYSRMVQLQQKSSPKATLSPYSHWKPSMQSPMSVRSSRQSSQASYHLSSAVYSISPVYSHIQDNTCEYQNEGNVNPSFSSYPRPSQWRLLQMNLPEWKRTLLGCLGAVGSGAVQPIHSYCLGTIVSIYFIKDNTLIKSEIKFYCCIFSILTVLSLIVNLVQHYNFAIMGERLTKRVREKMLGKVLTFEIGWFDQDENTSAAICARLATEANMVRSLIGDRMCLLVQVFAGASIAFILGLVITWRLAIVMIAIQPLLIGCYYSKSVLMKSMSEQARKSQNEGSQLASEAIVNHRTITAFSSQKRISNLFKATLVGPYKENIKQSWFAAFGLSASLFLTTASIALSFWYGGRLITQKLLTSKRLLQVFFILMSTGKSIADAGTMTSDLARGADAIRSLFLILDRKTEIEPDDPMGAKIKDTVKGHIELKNVFFSYPARPDQIIFKGLNLRIEAGEKVALVGESGSGKSTVIGLIERFYDPLKGSVEIDGKDIKSYNLRDLRSHIALVSQEPILFAGTIRENIAYGKENLTETELNKAATLANAHEFISSMKDGYETYCGERGVQLSGGQKQRIALARAILKDPAILLLDEATSALDSLSENLVQEALEKMMVGRTSVIVAHRLSTIQKSDSIAVIKNGKVAEQGSHSNLLAIGTGGSYFSLIKLQGNSSPYK